MRQLLDLSLETLAWRTRHQPENFYRTPEEMGYIDTGQRWLTEAQLAAESGPCQVVVPAGGESRRVAKRRRRNRLLAGSPAERRGAAARELLTRDVLAELYARGCNNTAVAAWATERIGHIGRGAVSEGLVRRIARELGLAGPVRP